MIGRFAASVAASDFPGETFRVLKEKELRGDLRALGYQVITIRYDRDLEEQVREYPDVFG